MKAKLFIIVSSILLLVSGSVFANVPYYGGSYDGFAMVGETNDYDDDGLSDQLEDTICTDFDDADTDDDGIIDGLEDANQSGVVDTGETDPCDNDTDNDGIQDGTELGYTTGHADTGAGFQPDLDPATQTDPLNADTDGDGVDDGVEDVNHNGRIDTGETNPNLVNGPYYGGSYDGFAMAGLLSCEDLLSFAQAFGTTNSGSDYNISCDSEPDGDIDGVDLGNFLQGYGL